jgi:alkylated DNA repair dioxygenase AlkB
MGPPSRAALRRLALHDTRMRHRVPAFTNHGVLCDRHLADSVLQYAATGITYVDTPEEAELLRQKGHDMPIARGRAHTRFRMFNQIRSPRRDIVTFARFRPDGAFATYRYGRAMVSRKKWRPVQAEDGVTTPYDLARLPWIEQVLAIVQQQTGERPNHCIMTRYCEPSDEINPHHDKTADLCPGSGIHSFSFGAPREFRCVHPDIAAGRWSSSVQTGHGHLLTLSWDDNLLYKHCVRPGAGTRVSLVLRTTRTWFDPAEGKSFDVPVPG